MAGNDQSGDRLGIDEIIRTFEERRDIDDDLAAATRVPTPKKPNQNDAVIALPEPTENGDDS
jgi:hypothetical protein